MLLPLQSQLTLILLHALKTTCSLRPPGCFNNKRIWDEEGISFIEVLKEFGSFFFGYSGASTKSFSPSSSLSASFLIFGNELLFSEEFVSFRFRGLRNTFCKVFFGGNLLTKESDGDVLFKVSFSLQFESTSDFTSGLQMKESNNLSVESLSSTLDSRRDAAIAAANCSSSFKLKISSCNAITKDKNHGKVNKTR